MAAGAAVEAVCGLLVLCGAFWASAVKGKKILFFVPSLRGGGAERVTLNLAEDWSGQGAEVVVVTLLSAETDAFAMPAGVRRIALGVFSEKFSPFAMLRYNILPMLALRRVLRAEKPDIAIGISTICAVILALVRGRDVIAVGAERFHPPLRVMGRFRHWLRRHCYARLDAVVALTLESADWLRRHTKARLVSVIPNSVYLPLPENEPRLLVGDVVASGRKFLLAVGRLDEQKAFDRLLDGFKQVAGRYGDWDLVILGEGELRGALEAQVASLSLAERVYLPGRAGNMGEWYSAADAFVMTSRYEGIPNALLEAMAHGCPAVSVDCDTGPRDIIHNGENGLLVTQNDSAALVVGLDRMLGDEVLRRHFASRAVEVLDRFAPKRIRRMWWELFDELATAGGR